jgi:hypothetical protein
MSEPKTYNIHQLCRALGIREAYYGLQRQLKKCGISHTTELELAQWLECLEPLAKPHSVAYRITSQIKSLK